MAAIRHDTGERQADSGDFYRRLRARIRRWARSKAGRRHVYLEYLLAAPDLFHLLCRLALDPQVRMQDKAKLAVAIAYFVSPIDLVSEAVLGPIAFVDDVAFAASVLHGMISHDPALVRRYWSGDRDVIELIERILASVDDMLGPGLWQKVKRLARR
jgi:uncharacterized membrane protein YkvA (DUF1232 family)